VKNWLKNIFKTKECQLLPWEEEFRNYYLHFQELLRVRKKLLDLLAPKAVTNLQVISDLCQRLLDLLNKIFDQKLGELLKVSPLFREARNLTDIENILSNALSAPDFSDCRHVMPDSFRRLHPQTLGDYLSLIHELAVEEMFSLLDIYDLRKIKAVPVQTGLPIKLHVIDLGGGVCASDVKMIGKDEILSAPMQAMFKGMYYPGISWSGPIGVNLKGFMVIMAQSSSRPEEDFWDKTYLLAARDYMNFNSRLGYHYTSVASFLSEEPLDNHIRFTLKGGAADDIRRARRARFIGQVLDRVGFEVHVHQDLIEGRLTNTDRALTEDRLDLIGRLMGCVRQRDMVMNSDATVNWYAEAFLRGNYSFEPDQ
jgi:pyruvate, water dikinase